MTLEITVMSLDFDADDGIQTKQFESPILKIGRSDDCDLVLNGDGVSNEHALLQVNFSGNEPTIEIIDLASTNGTMIDNRPIVPNLPQVLKKNQRVMIGSYLIRPSIIAEFAHKNGSNGHHVEPVQEFEEQPVIGRIIPKPHHDIVEEQDDPAYESVATVTNDQPDFHMFDDLLTAKSSDKSVPTQIKTVNNPEPQLAHAEPKFNDIPKYQPQAAQVNTFKPEASKISAISSSSEGVYTTEGVVSDENIELELEAQKLVSLKVKVLRNGKPFSGVNFSAGAMGNFVTDSNGTFTANDLLEGLQFALQPSLPGFKITGSQLSGLLDQDKELVFNAAKLCDIKGRIVHRGQPLAGVVVDGGAMGQVTSDAAGYYCFKDIPEGTHYKLSVKKSGFIFRKN